MFCKKAEKGWFGRWIWDRGDGQEENVWYLFRREIELKNVDNSIIYVSAVKRYRLYINGKLIGSGPPLSQPFNQYYDSYDVSGYLKKGRNTIAVEVHFSRWGENNRAGLLLELLQAGEQVVASDENWKLKRANAWQQNTAPANSVIGYEEVYDARLEPEGWMLEGFDDSRWYWCQIIKGMVDDVPPAVAPWIFLKPRDIPVMKEEEVYPARVVSVEEALDIKDLSGHRIRVSDQLSMDAVKPLEYSNVKDVENLLYDNKNYTEINNSLKHLDIDNWFDGVYNPCIVLDFGKIISGHVEITVEGVNGGILDIGYSERLVDGHFISSVSERSFADRYIMKDGVQKFRSFYWKSFRYLKLKTKECYKPIKIYELKGIFNTYPFEYKGSFLSNDTFYNKLWDNCRNTIQLCSNEFIMDTPWREQHQWLGDVAAVTLGGIYTAFGDVKLASKFIKQAAYSQNQTGMMHFDAMSFSSNLSSAIFPDYNLFWVQALWNHYMFTGDEDYLHTYYPHVVKIVQFFENSKDEYGLVQNMGTRIFIDHFAGDKRGENAFLNALYIGTLDYVRKMAILKGDSYIVDFCNNISAEMREVFNNHFWNEEKGVYEDTWVRGSFGSTISEHSNILTIAYGICDKNRTERIINNLYEQKKVKYLEATPYATYFVINAFQIAGRLDLAMQIIKERWGRMIKYGADTTWEEWGIYGSWRDGDKYNARWRSLSHAWSAGPLEFLSKKITGFEILEPGCSKVKLNPTTGGFEFYDIVIPTPKGEIKVTYRKGVFETVLPENMERVK